MAGRIQALLTYPAASLNPAWCPVLCYPDYGLQQCSWHREPAQTSAARHPGPPSHALEVRENTATHDETQRNKTVQYVQTDDT